MLFVIRYLFLTSMIRDHPGLYCLRDPRIAHGDMIQYTETAEIGVRPYTRSGLNVMGLVRI